MQETERLAELFEAERPRLSAIAYRMLGSVADADDAVQNSWIRLQRTDSGGIDSVSAWLTAVVGHECLKLLRSRRTRRETVLPDAEPPSSAPLLTGSTGPDPEAAALIGDAVGPALMIVLDSLSPDARLAFVLHDIFAVPFEEIAGIIGRTVPATRQLASRARRKVRGASVPERPDPARHRQLVDAFLAALREGNLTALVAALDPDVVLLDDSRSLPGSSPDRMRGAGRVATYAAGFARRARHVEPASVDDRPGLIIVPNGRVVGALAFTVAGDLITRIELISDPEALQAIKPRA